MRITREDEAHIADVLRAAREIQEFLWGDEDEPGYDFDLWREMLWKRLRKLEALVPENPHAVIELRKRLLQTAAVAVAWLVALDNDEKAELAAVTTDQEKAELECIKALCYYCRDELAVLDPGSGGSQWLHGSVICLAQTLHNYRRQRAAKGTQKKRWLRALKLTHQKKS